MSDIGIFTRRRIISPAESYFAAPAAAVGGGGAPAWIKTDSPAEGTPSTSVAFASVALGTADATRVTIVCVNTTTTVCTGVDVGGVTATKAIEEATTLSGLQIWYANTSGLGTTATITLSAGGMLNSPNIRVGRLTNCNATPTATNSANNGGADPSTITATVPSTGFGIVWICAGGDTSGGAWTNATEDYKTFLGNPPNLTISMAYTGTSGSQTPTFTGMAGGGSHIVMACFGP